MGLVSDSMLTTWIDSLSKRRLVSILGATYLDGLPWQRSGWLYDTVPTWMDFFDEEEAGLGARHFLATGGQPVLATFTHEVHIKK